MTTHRRRTHGLGRRLRGLPRAVAVGLLACLVALSAALDGAPYFWCAPMSEARLSCCCAGHRAAADADAVSPEAVDAHRADAVAQSPCCEGRRVTSLPVSNTPARVNLSVPPALLAALLPVELLASVDDSAPVSSPRPVRHIARAGPDLALFALYHSYLN